MMRLKWLKIDKYPNVQPGTELHFNDGFNILLGKNGSGKTSLLNLMVRILRADFDGLQNETLNIKYRFEIEDLHIEVHCESEPEKSSPFIEKSTPKWKYRIHIQKEGVTHSTPTRSSEGSSSKLDFYRSSFFAREVADLISEHRISSNNHYFTLLNNSFYRFDEGLDIFRSITNFEGTNRIHASASIQVDLPSRRVVATSGHFLPREASSKLGLTQNHGESTDIIYNSKEMSFISRLTQALGYHHAEMRLQFLESRNLSDTSTSIFRYSPMRFYLFDQPGYATPHELLSFGEKRLLAFHYYAACNPNIIVADELVNGLHHSWIENCLDLIQDRQAFLTSQNPLLLDYLPFDTAADVQHSFVLCDRPQGRAGGWRWRNMSEAESAAVMRAYNVGIQHVSEILRDKGLW